MKDYFGIILTELQAKELISWSDRLKIILFRCESQLDQADRDILLAILVKKVMKNHPDIKSKTKSTWIAKWVVPDSNSTEEYKLEFDKAFKKAAKKARIVCV